MWKDCHFPQSYIVMSTEDVTAAALNRAALPEEVEAAAVIALMVLEAEMSIALSGDTQEPAGMEALGTEGV